MGMKPGMKMLAMAKTTQGGRMGGYDREMNEQPEMRRRRDDRGRYMGGDEMRYNANYNGGDEMRYNGNYNGNYNGGDMNRYSRRNEMRGYPQEQRQIGFEQNRSGERRRMDMRQGEDMPEMRRRRDKRGRYMGDDDSDMRGEDGNVAYFPRESRRMHHGEGGKGQKVEAGGTFWMIPPSESHEKLTREKAEKWVRSMYGDDPKERGEMWSYEDAKPLAEARGIPTEGQEMIDFYAVLNMVYNDYAKVAKEYDVDHEDYYADLACAWLYDSDGKPPTEKVMAYKKHVIPREEE